MATVDKVSGSPFAAGGFKQTAFEQSAKIAPKSVIRQRLPFQGVPAVAEPVSRDRLMATEHRPATERALEQLEESYARLVDSVNLSLFNSARINQYIAQAEKRDGIQLSTDEKARIRRLAETGDEQTLRLLALELRVGVPQKAEREALAALGELFLQRHDRPTLERFLADETKDENLKAHVRTILLVNRVEGTMHFYHSVKSDLTSLLKPEAWRSLLNRPALHKG